MNQQTGSSLINSALRIYCLVYSEIFIPAIPTKKHLTSPTIAGTNQTIVEGTYTLD
jgi:hypothetical protein